MKKLKDYQEYEAGKALMEGKPRPKGVPKKMWKRLATLRARKAVK